MKKLLAVVMTFVMLLTVIGCTKVENNDPEEGNISGMESPLTAYDTLDLLGEAAKCAMIKPEGFEVTDEAFQMISGAPEIAEYRFKADGVDCVLRFADAPVGTDISGIQTDEGPLLEGKDGETLAIIREEYKVQRWLTVDGQYVLEVFDGDEWEWTKFDDLASQFMKMEPRTWSSTVPFADYLAISGSYNNDEAGYYGAVNIKDDHAAVYVLGGQSVDERKYWEIEAVLEDGKLVYDSEKISSIVYDSETGETTNEELEPGGAGYIEVSDGKLIFSGAYSEELKDLVLTYADNQY